MLDLIALILIITLPLGIGRLILIETKFRSHIAKLIVNLSIWNLHIFYIEVMKGLVSSVENKIIKPKKLKYIFLIFIFVNIISLMYALYWSHAIICTATIHPWKISDLWIVTEESFIGLCLFLGIFDFVSLLTSWKLLKKIINEPVVTKTIKYWVIDFIIIGLGLIYSLLALPVGGYLQDIFPLDPNLSLGASNQTHELKPNPLLQTSVVIAIIFFTICLPTICHISIGAWGILICVLEKIKNGTTNILFLIYNMKGDVLVYITTVIIAIFKFIESFLKTES